MANFILNLLTCAGVLDLPPICAMNGVGRRTRLGRCLEVLSVRPQPEDFIHHLRQATHNRNIGQVLPWLLMLPFTLRAWPPDQESSDPYVRGPNIVSILTTHKARCRASTM